MRPNGRTGGGRNKRNRGYELLHFAGYRTIENANDMPPKSEDSIIVGVDHLAPSILGETGPRAANGTVILQTIIVLSPDAFAPPYTAADIALHEMLHAIGLNHGAQDSLFPTTMAPAAQPKLRGLQPGDIAAIRAAYAR